MNQLSLLASRSTTSSEQKSETTNKSNLISSEQEMNQMNKPIDIDLLLKNYSLLYRGVTEFGYAPDDSGRMDDIWCIFYVSKEQIENVYENTVKDTARILKTPAKESLVGMVIDWAEKKRDEILHIKFNISESENYQLRNEGDGKKFYGSLRHNISLLMELNTIKKYIKIDAETKFVDSCVKRILNEISKLKQNTQGRNLKKIV